MAADHLTSYWCADFWMSMKLLVHFLRRRRIENGPAVPRGGILGAISISPRIPARVTCAAAAVAFVASAVVAAHVFAAVAGFVAGAAAPSAAF